MTSDLTALRLRRNADRANADVARSGRIRGGIPHPRNARAAATIDGEDAGRRDQLFVALAAGDLLASLASSLLGAIVLSAVAPTRTTGSEIDIALVLTVAAGVGIALHAHRLSRPLPTTIRPSHLWRLATTAPRLPAAAILALAGNALLSDTRELTLTAALVMVAPAAFLVPLVRRTAYRLAFGRPTSRILVVGSGDVAERVASRLRRCSDTDVVGHVDDDPASDERVLGGLTELGDLCRRHDVDRIVVAFSRTPPLDTVTYLRDLSGGIPISVVPRMFELHSWRSDVEELHGIPLLHIAPAQLGRAARAAKRTLDVTVALTALVFLAPSALVVAALIKLDSPGPVLFRQERTGRGGRVFSIYKFRTMVADAEGRHDALTTQNEVDGPLFKMHQDPRVTRVGSLLRRTSLDELPQLLNVVRGDMSLVGPRPLPVEESARLGGAALTRFRVAPGITGLWQVSGRSDLCYADLQHLDSVYVQSWSLLWDLKILLGTPSAVFARRGAY